MYTNDRNLYRQSFYTAWQKHKRNLSLKPIESQLVHLILMHPEYQPFLENNSSVDRNEFAIEENPFLHMSLHLAIHEQISTNRPIGIKDLATTLQTKYKDRHEMEHHMMNCLAQILWQAHHTGKSPDELEYLEKLRRL